jgi:penicillin-binding protein 1A
MKMKPFIIKNFKRILFILSLVITILIGTLIGIILVYQKGFPQIENLEDVQPNVMSVIYDDNGEPIKEFAAEKRTIIRRPDIPEILEKALVASEDNQFYTHWGINFRGTLRAIMGVLTGQNLGGGSSITQQLARNYFLTAERTFSRKFREILLAIQIEKRYSKDQILTAYCNKIYLGGGVYGVEAAARYYFGKSIKDVNIAEAALIPAIMPNPNRTYNVFLNPANCLRKRDDILKRMVEMDFITETQYREAVKVPLPTEPHQFDRPEVGDYFVEEVRKRLESRFGDRQLYTGGLNIYTSLNSHMQKWAENAMSSGLRAHDKRRGWRGGLKNLLRETSEAGTPTDLQSHKLASWERLTVEKDSVVEGIVLTVTNKKALVKFGGFRGIVSAADAAWTNMPLKGTLKKGDVGLFKILDIPDTDSGLFSLGLEQEPEAEGAVLVIENSTGEIKAMVGGYSFKRSQWNNATRALRQPGSTLKPIIYTAAIENGFSPATLMEDEPVTFANRWTDEPYEPQNDSRDFAGTITLRMAFEQSRNVISAKIVNYLTPPEIVKYARRFGISADFKPTMSIALGAYEATLIDMTAAYTVFPNLGVRVTPYFIKKIVDRNGHILEENYPDKRQVIEEETAYIINYLMQGVVQYGTGKRARHLKAPIGGKTGTTDDYTDAWFIGFSPSVTVGVWVGYDTRKSLGNQESGSRAACPVFVEFMEKYLEQHDEPRNFRKPPGIIMIKIDKRTGKLVSPDCIYPFWEAFIRGREPVDFCKVEDHEKIVGYHDEIKENDEE